jgi:hypothetical protein
MEFESRWGFQIVSKNLSKHEVFLFQRGHGFQSVAVLNFRRRVDRSLEPRVDRFDRVADRCPA